MTHLFNDGKYPWLPIIISIGSHAEIDLFRVWISIVSGRQLENAVHHGDGSESVCRKGLMDMTHLSGGARGTFCQSSAKRIESRRAHGRVNGSRLTARHDSWIREMFMDLLDPGSHGEHEGDEKE